MSGGASANYAAITPIFSIGAFQLATFGLQLEAGLDTVDKDVQSHKRVGFIGNGDLQGIVLCVKGGTLLGEFFQLSCRDGVEGVGEETSDLGHCVFAMKRRTGN